MTKKIWTTSSRQRLLETPVFSLRRDRKERTTRGGKTHDFFVIEAVDWVNVVPLTTSGEIVFIELHRHGTDEVSLEIPGGMVDAEDASPMEAARREMREETGYTSDRLIPLGVVHPNPALQGNRCFSFLAPDAQSIGAQRLDETEDIEVVTYPESDVPRLLREGKITHALVVAGLFWFLQHQAISGERT